jgi:hypothetical protein
MPHDAAANHRGPIKICDHDIDLDQALDILAGQTFNVIVSDIAMLGRRWISLPIQFEDAG